MASTSSVITMDSTSTSSPRSRSRSRSWVIGRGGSIPCSARAIDVASSLPMRIGSVRPGDPLALASFRRMTGTLSGICTRIDANVISITGSTLPPVQRFHVGGGIVPEGGHVAGDDVVEVAIQAEVVEAVPEHELVGDDEADVLDRRRHDPPSPLVEQRTNGERTGTAPLELVAEEGQRQPGVDD